MTRTTYRRFGLAVAAFVLVALPAYTLNRYHQAHQLTAAADRFQRTVGPLETAAYQPPAVPAEENAVPLLETATERLRSAGSAAAIPPATRRKPIAAWTGQELSEVRDILASQETTLDLLYEAAARSRSSFDLPYEQGPEMPIPNLLMYLKAGDLLLAEGRVAAADGNREDAAHAIEALGALSRAIQNEPPLVFQVVGHAEARRQVRAIRANLAAGGGDRSDLERLRASLPPARFAESFRRAVGTEGAVLYWVRPSGPGAGEITGYLGKDSASAYDSPKGELYVARGLDSYVRVASVYAGSSYAALHRRAGFFAPPKPAPPLTDPHLHLVTDFGPTLGEFKGTESMDRLARLALQLADEGLRTGHYPDSLAGLEGGSSPDPLTGSPVVYRRLGDGSATLSVPGAEALWETVRPRQHLPGEEDLFTWALPSLAPARSGASD